MSRHLLFSVGIKDCRVDTFTVGGHGGSGKDTSNTGVRITHLASGATGRAVDTRQQSKNKALAFRRMGETPTFKAWVRLQAATFTSGPTIEERVEDAMDPENIKIEIQQDGKWIEVSDAKSLE